METIQKNPRWSYGGYDGERGRFTGQRLSGVVQLADRSQKGDADGQRFHCAISTMPRMHLSWWSGTFSSLMIWFNYPVNSKKAGMRKTRRKMKNGKINDLTKIFHREIMFWDLWISMTGESLTQNAGHARWISNQLPHFFTCRDTTPNHLEWNSREDSHLLHEPLWQVRFPSYYQGAWTGSQVLYKSQYMQGCYC